MLATQGFWKRLLNVLLPPSTYLLLVLVSYITAPLLKPIPKIGWTWFLGPVGIALSFTTLSYLILILYQYLRWGTTNDTEILLLKYLQRKLHEQNSNTRGRPLQDREVPRDPR